MPRASTPASKITRFVAGSTTLSVTPSSARLSAVPNASTDDLGAQHPPPHVGGHGRRGRHHPAAGARRAVRLREDDGAGRRGERRREVRLVRLAGRELPLRRRLAVDDPCDLEAALVDERDDAREALPDLADAQQRGVEALAALRGARGCCTTRRSRSSWPGRGRRRRRSRTACRAPGSTCRRCAAGRGRRGSRRANGP